MDLTSVQHWIVAYKYAIIFPITVFQGATAMMLFGFILRLGYLEFLPLYLTVLAADLTGDFLWYGIGYWWVKPLLKRHGRFFNLTEKRLEKIERMLHAHQKKILFISKTTLGFGVSNLTLMAAGAARIPLKVYALINLAGGVIWVGALIGIGYFFGNLYLQIARGFEVAAIIVFALLAFFAVHGIGRVVLRKFMERGGD